MSYPVKITIKCYSNNLFSPLYRIIIVTRMNKSKSVEVLKWLDTMTIEIDYSTKKYWRILVPTKPETKLLAGMF